MRRRRRRHAMFVDQKTEAVDVPLNTALGAQGKLELANSAPAHLISARPVLC
jgi:hypothetical protein